MRYFKRIVHGLNWARLRNENELIAASEIERIKAIPRRVPGVTRLFGSDVAFVDSASYISIFEEVFLRGIYEFNSGNDKPYIIDVGSNIGLSIIYFKRLFPKARVLGFEADSYVFDCLEKNICSFRFDDVEIHNKAVWDSEGFIGFLREGADAGRISGGNGFVNEEKETLNVETVRLSTFIDRKVDFLKIDIEGAETVVLKELEGCLHFVERLFVEYHSFVGKDQTVHQLLATLRDAGFRVFIQHHNVFSSKPFVLKNEYLGMDMQLNIFAFR